MTAQPRVPISSITNLRVSGGAKLLHGAVSECRCPRPAHPPAVNPDRKGEAEASYDADDAIETDPHAARPAQYAARITAADGSLTLVTVTDTVPSTP